MQFGTLTCSRMAIVFCAVKLTLDQHSDSDISRERSAYGLRISGRIPRSGIPLNLVTELDAEYFARASITAWRKLSRVGELNYDVS